MVGGDDGVVVAWWWDGVVSRWEGRREFRVHLSLK